MINCVCIADEMVLVDSDDDEERKLLLSESPSLTNSPVITKELVKEAARGSRRQLGPEHGAQPRSVFQRQAPASVQTPGAQ